jgi:hypothetical protein
MTIEKPCKECGELFEPNTNRNGNEQIYCSDTCKGASYRKRKKSLGVLSGDASRTAHGIVDRKQDGLIHHKMNTLTPPDALPVSAKFIVDELTRQRNKLETQVETHAKKIETLMQEKIALEKDRDRLQGELEQKPGALQGFLSNPEQAKDMITQSIAGVIELVRAMRPDPSGAPAQLQSGQPPIGQGEMALLNWFKGQPPVVSQGMIDIMNSLATNQERAAELIAYFKRSMMQAGVNVANG